MSEAATLRVAASGPIRIITLNRPQARNAINLDLAERLVAAVREIDEDPAARVGIITGADGYFCAGMDLKAFLDSALPLPLADFLERGARKPLVAAVEVFAIAGGMELALACDLIVAGRTAKFGIPEVRLGLLAAGGALVHLPRRIGYGIAMRLNRTGESLRAEDLYPSGLIAEITDDTGALNAAVRLAEAIAADSPTSVIASKQVVVNTAHLPEPEAWTYQRPIFDWLISTPDGTEGARALAEKTAAAMGRPAGPAISYGLAQATGQSSADHGVAKGAR